MTRYSEVSYTYSGGSKVFTIPFSYLKTEHINVFIDDVEATNFEFNTTSQIQINDEITSGQVVKIIRTTPIDSRMVNFNDRSVLNAQQQNLDSNQLFNVVQEVYDRNDNFTEDIQTQVDTANTNASAAISTANTASSKADTAVSTANAAETKADNAVSTANSASSVANTASTNATNAVNTANSASSAATAASNKVDEFGQSIETVVEAASKINQLEQSVTTATNAAITATNKASEANTSATTANQKVTEITNLITDFNNQKGQANGIAPLDANTKLQLIHIPTGVELTANKGVANGYAELDADGKVPKAQLPNTGSGLEICDIGMALYVDETKGLRRYLNGQIVDINTNTQAFLNRLQQITTLYPALLCTEEEWQTAKTSSAFGQVGKFVFNYTDDGTTIVSVRIPRVVNVQGLFDLQNLGMTVAESLPNIKGSVYLGTTTVEGTGAMSVDKVVGHGSSKGASTDRIKFNASDYNTTYQDGAPVQQEAIQYPYFIQIATGSETENNIINDIELNNPYSLFECKYADHELFNLSWLVSNGSYNGSNAVHPSAYQALLVENNAEVAIGSTVTLPNGTEYTKQGLSVKLSTETYTDYDFVVNPADETFRPPIKPNNLNNTRYLIETGEQDEVSYRIYADGYCEQWGFIPSQTRNDNFQVTLLKEFVDTNYNLITNKWIVANVSTNVMSYSFYTKNKTTNGFTTAVDPNVGCSWRASGYLAEGEYTPITDNILLYYYVGETVQNANLIDAGRIGEQLTGKLDRSAIKSYITETYQNGTSGYRIYSDGYCEQWGQSTTTNASVSITFVKPLKTVVGGSSAILNSAASFTSVTGLTTTGCTLAAGRWGSSGSISGTGTNVPVAWVIYGYLADGQY